MPFGLVLAGIVIAWLGARVRAAARNDDGTDYYSATFFFTIPDSPGSSDVDEDMGRKAGNIVNVTAPELLIGVLASGAGTTLQAVIDACEDGTIDGRVAVVIGNNSASGATARARQHGIPFVHVSAHTQPDAAQLDAAIRDALRDHDASLVLLAGYMKKIGPATLAAFPERIVNTHPALLPNYGGCGMYGNRVHEAVLAGGDKVTGISVHLVDDRYDTGRVIAQKSVPVERDDDVAALAARVQSHEREFLVDVLRQIASGDINLSA